MLLFLIALFAVTAFNATLPQQAIAADAASATTSVVASDTASVSTEETASVTANESALPKPPRGYRWVLKWVCVGAGCGTELFSCIEPTCSCDWWSKHVLVRVRRWGGERY